MEEAMVHEANFRESITMLVVQDNFQSSGSEADSDTEPVSRKNLEHLKDKTRTEKGAIYTTLGTSRRVNDPSAVDNHLAEAGRFGLKNLDKQSTLDINKEYGETEALLRQQ